MKRILAILLITLLLASCAPAPAEVRHSPFPETSAGAPPDSSSPTSEPPPIPEPSSDDSLPTPEPSSDEPPPTPEPSFPPVELEEYTGPLYHAFFHFLIAFPEIAYSNSYGRNLDTDTVTPIEYRRALEEFYRNDFVLMNLSDYFEILPDGTVVRKPIMVPVGKKPLILSYDDINYYSRNLGLGICDKVILDENGKLAMSTKMPDGSTLITYDNCVIPALEAFVEEFPDFSPFGHKGLLAVTGFDGILGYRTQRDSPNRESEIEAVKPVVQALLDAGWYFGSHSYAHRDMGKNTLARLREDTQKWRDEVGSLVGDTIIYIFPYGARTSWDDPRFLSLIDDGFPLLMGVGFPRIGDPPYIRHRDNYFFMDRWNIDGISLRREPNRLTPLLNADFVYSREERNGVPRT